MQDSRNSLAPHPRSRTIVTRAVFADTADDAAAGVRLSSSGHSHSVAAWRNPATRPRCRLSDRSALQRARPPVPCK